MKTKVVPNVQFLIDEFFERAGSSCAYRSDEFFRENPIDAEKETPTFKTEQLGAHLQDRIKDVFYELFEVEREEDASIVANEGIERSLHEISRALETVARRVG